MRRIFTIAALAGAALVAITTNAPAPPPPPPLPLINRMVQQSANDYDRLSGKSTPELWIHVRSIAEAQLVERNIAWLSGLRFGGRPMVVHPPLLVSVGPSVNQLRIFKTQDRQPVGALEASLAAFVAPLQIQDLSRSYQGLIWIAPGRVELWLAPNLTRFGPAP